MVELGVFLPVGNNGWIMSATAPQYMPTWELNRDITLMAEEFGLDYVFSMAKWRGLGGSTDFWDYTVESLSLMTALAPTTSRVRLIGSISPALMHPAIFAKMAVTLDHVSHGRFTLNIVSAGVENIIEYSQMGLYPENFDSYRYPYTEEWLNIAKALWSKPSVTFKGQYFTLEDCHSDPKPVQRPHPPIVCATTSDRGFRFVAEHCDAAFVGGNTMRLRDWKGKLGGVAAEYGRDPKIHALIMLIITDTDDEGQRLVKSYWEGADWDSMWALHGPRLRQPGEQVTNFKERLNQPAHLFYYTPTYVGAPETIADAIEDLAMVGGADGLVLTFPDYIDGLTRLHRDVMPILRNRGVLPAAAVAAAG